MNTQISKKLTLSNSQILLFSFAIIALICASSVLDIFAIVTITIVPPLTLALFMSNNKWYLISSYVIAFIISISISLFLFQDIRFLFTFFCVIVLSIAEFFAATNFKTRFSMIIAFCVSFFAYTLVYLCVYLLITGNNFDYLVSKFNETLDFFKANIIDSAKIMNQKEELSKSAILDFAENFMLTLKLYFVPMIIAYCEVAAYLGTSIFSKILKSEPNKEISDEYNFTLKFSKITSIVFFITYLVYTLAMLFSNAFTIGLSCLYLILLPFYAILGIDFLYKILLKKTKYNAKIFTSLICVVAVMFLGINGIAILGFIGFWASIIPDNVRKSL